MPVARAYSEWVARSSIRARSKARTKVKGAAESPAATAAQSRVESPITSTAKRSAGSEARMPTRLRTASASERGSLAATKPNSAPATSVTAVAGSALRTVALMACSVSLSMSRPRMSVPKRNSADGAASSAPMPVALARGIGEEIRQAHRDRDQAQADPARDPQNRMQGCGSHPRLCRGRDRHGAAPVATSG